MFTTIVLWIASLLAAGIAIILIIALTRPNTFRIERNIAINAPPEKVFPLLNDFHAWTQWSPWEKLDPDLKRTYSGPSAGKGSVYEWEGNKNVGQGRMEITESVPASRILIDLRFLRPFKADNITDFTLTPTVGGTAVNWAMTGQHVFVAKVMCMFMDMDKMVGKDFEKGLANMKAAAER